MDTITQWILVTFVLYLLALSAWIIRLQQFMSNGFESVEGGLRYVQGLFFRYETPDSDEAIQAYIKLYLDTCEAQNGVRVCKNCGLGSEVLLEDEDETAEGVWA